MKAGRPVVLVTGAGGFIGSHVVRTLLDGGWDVRPVLRRASGMFDNAVIKQVGPDTPWDDALADVDAVVHLAARVHHRNDEHAADLYRDVNVEGTLHLARRAAAAGVRDFIFVSTVLVHGRSNDGRTPFRESDAPTPHGLYGTSKAEAEAGLRPIAQGSGLHITVIRPPMVYGRGAPGNFALLKKVVEAGVPLPLGGIDNRRAFVSVDNLASFVLYRLTQRTDDRFEIFLVADDEQVSTPDFIARLGRAADRPARLVRLPRPLLNALLKATGRREINDSLLGSLALDVSKAASTGWRPAVSLDEALRRAVDKPTG